MKRKFDFRNSTAGTVVAVVIVFLLLCAISFFATAGILWLLCHAFHWTWWSWGVSVAIWLALGLLSGTTFRVKVE